MAKNAKPATAMTKKTPMMRMAPMFFFMLTLKNTIKTALRHGEFPASFGLMVGSLSVDQMLEEMLRNQHCVILDVRSESEFADSHVPGALSLPLLNDAERAEIGTLYKRQSAAAALERALEFLQVRRSFSLFAELLGKRGASADEIAEPSTSEFAAAFGLVRQSLYVQDGHVRFKTSESFEPSRLRSDRHLIFYCWRGGARSRSMATVFHSLGFKVSVVEAGHKAFRKRVLDYLNAPKYPFELCTLYGLTGCGKTKILQGWKAEGRAVIDLEALAYHRGSAFGQIGIEKFGAQKEFENTLFFEMFKYEKAGAARVYVEGESRRIGRCQLPEAFMQAMLDGRHVKVERSLEERVELILREYVEPVSRTEWFQGACRSLESIQKRLGGEKFKELRMDLQRGDNASFVRKLLVDYYDKAYLLSREDANFYHEVI